MGFMLKKEKLFNGNIRLHLAKPDICLARNSSMNPRSRAASPNKPRNSELNYENDF